MPIRSYWDWADKRVATDGIPPVLIDEKVEIILPPLNQHFKIENPIAWFPINTIPDFPADFVDEVDDVNVRSGAPILLALSHITSSAAERDLVLQELEAHHALSSE